MKMILVTLFSAVLLSSCHTKNYTDLERFRAKTELETQNKAVVLKLFELMSKQDLAYGNLFSEDCKIYIPSGNPTPQNLTQELTGAKEFWTDYPEIIWTVEKMVADSDIIVTRYIITGRSKAGVNLKFGGILMDRLENGRIVEERHEYDQLGFMNQMGMELKPIKTK